MAASTCRQSTLPPSPRPSTRASAHCRSRCRATPTTTAPISLRCCLPARLWCSTRAPARATSLTAHLRPAAWHKLTWRLSLPRRSTRRHTGSCAPAPARPRQPVCIACLCSFDLICCQRFATQAATALAGCTTIRQPARSSAPRRAAPPAAWTAAQQHAARPRSTVLAVARQTGPAARLVSPAQCCLRCDSIFYCRAHERQDRIRQLRHQLSGRHIRQRPTGLVHVQHVPNPAERHRTGHVRPCLPDWHVHERHRLCRVVPPRTVSTSIRPLPHRRADRDANRCERCTCRLDLLLLR